jgi:tetratricopeptide (TPR) repeat protein
MKIKKDAVRGIIIGLAIILAVFSIYHIQKQSARNSIEARIRELAPRGGGPPQNNEDLRKAIGLYEQKIEQHVKDAAQTGVYWKILATRLHDKGLHTEALDALEHAIQYTPEDPILFYLAGLSAAVLAKSSLDFPGRGDASAQDRYYELAEQSYIRAISLDDRYNRPRYGLSILYVFEFGRPAEAVPHLLRVLEIAPSDTDAMFILARAYFMTEQYGSAIDMYDRIIAASKDAAKKKEAENNKEAVLQVMYGQG